MTFLKPTLLLYQNRVNQHLTALLDQQTGCPASLLEAIKYATLNNGKRLRPALVYAVGESLNISLEKLDAAACAIELIHSYSLVHDDLPAMDDDDLRRGQPTCHVQYDEATAILVGDAQQTFAFEILSKDPLTEDADKVKLITLLSQASGAIGMIGGQIIDIQSNGHLPELSQLQKMHDMKTGALITAALLMGAVQSPLYNKKQPGLVKLGQKIGLAFQVHDDILDIEGSTDVLGKPQGSDEAAGKSTYPKLLGLSQSKKLRDELISESLETLSSLQLNNPFLKELITYIACRQY
ncbi:polyprenyl synthetase family protein [Hydrogenovibrio sp. 3SP14C1]|uniref:polyprenyl synthetase family protein n=1 Tax=Hydrogenovibrio sp. 3SP14C1 TaxID=3038774 RepID=UPI002417F31C|nr:farnesyl diphosphate synthase [Hydrogenovibrio sp. 3SP14C1]MDG4812990.1 polyprenyl synthetase family protein [Hydrogenovibrio sp. 3SP14C1]